MRKNDFDGFDALMQGIAENYGQTLSPQGIALRFKALENFDLVDVQRAAMSILESRKYTTMPTVADFMEHLGGGSIEDRAEVEAGKVLDAIGRHGSYASVVFDDPVTMAVINSACGGWVKLCEDCGSEESEKWFRKDFVKTWGAYKRQGVQYFGILPGRHEIGNVSGGMISHIPKPVFIGDETKAQNIFALGMHAETSRISCGERHVSGMLPQIINSARA